MDKLHDAFGWTVYVLCPCSQPILDSFCAMMALTERFKVSSDGFKFEQVTAAQGRTVFLTADQVGVFANSGKTTSSIPRVISFLHWSQA